jgi:glycerol-3-phosphate acyltransferase PlsX
VKPIVVDAMGGDYAPAEAVAGVALFARENPDVPVVLVGNEAEVTPLIKRNFPDGMGQVAFRHASENVANDDEVRTARRKKDSSLAVGIRMMKEGEGSALVALGNTAAVVGLTHLGWGLLPGVSRAGIAVTFPNGNGATLAIDMGANTMSKPEHLLDYGVMASIYMEKVMGVKSPRVGLINVGEEYDKGGEEMRKVYGLFEHAPFNFQGNAEGRDLVSGKFDVVVCDGFVGNVALKAAESVAEFVTSEIKKALMKNLQRKILAFFLKGAFRDAKKSMDYSEYGGMPLLGVNGICIIGHGRSRAVAFKNAIRCGHQAVMADLCTVITSGLAAMHKDEDKRPAASA